MVRFTGRLLLVILLVFAAGSLHAQDLAWVNGPNLLEGPNDDDVGVNADELLPGTPDTPASGSLVQLILDGGNGVADPPTATGTGVSGDDTFLAGSYVGRGGAGDGVFAVFAPLSTYGLTVNDHIFVRIFDRPNPTASEVPPLQSYSGQTIINYPEVAGKQAFFYADGEVKRVGDLPFTFSYNYVFDTTSFDGISEWSYLYLSTPAPNIFAPVPTAAGTTNMHLLPTGTGVVTITGDKTSDEWTALEVSPGVFSTAGITQVSGSTNWSCQAPYDLSADETMQTVRFKGLSSDQASESADSTTLYLANFGYGSPFAAATGFVYEGGSQVTLQGTNDLDVSGTLLISNALNGFTAAVPAPASPTRNWSVSGFNLAVGQNPISVISSNLSGQAHTSIVEITFAPIPADLPAPSFSSPLAINAAQTGYIFEPAGTGIVAIAGAKQTGYLACMDTGAPLCATGGIVQTLAGTSWSASVPYSLPSQGQSTSAVMRAFDPTAFEISTDATTLIISNFGFGVPSVAFDASSATSAVPWVQLSGTINRDVIGQLVLSNQANGAAITFDAPVSPISVWSATPFPLEAGPNLLRVSGTNLSGTIAQDLIMATGSFTSYGANTRYVSPFGGSIYPYESWADAATNIQDAIDAAFDFDTIVIADGTYLLADPITVFPPVDIIGLNGPDGTIVDGQHISGCIELYSSQVTLNGLTVQNGETLLDGAGLYSASGATILNCVFRNNTASSITDPLNGGGVFISSQEFDPLSYIHIQDSLFTSNRVQTESSTASGGGLYIEDLHHTSQLINSVIEHNTVGASNSQAYGGGVFADGNVDIINSIIHHNRAVTEGTTAKFNKGFGGGVFLSTQSTLNGCRLLNNTIADNILNSVNPRGAGAFILRAPFLGQNNLFWNNRESGLLLNNWFDGSGQLLPLENFSSGEIAYGAETNLPAFLDTMYRPAANLGVIDTGLDLSSEGVDEDFVYQERGYDGNNDGTAGYDFGAWEIYDPNADSDQDGAKDGAEKAAETDPLDSNSVFQVQAIAIPGTDQTRWRLSWKTESGRSYRLVRSTNLMHGFDFTVQSGIPDTAPLNVVTDTVPNTAGPFYYRAERE